MVLQLIWLKGPDPMDWKNLYLTSTGRLGQKDFWLSWLILLVISILAGWVLGMVHVLASTVVGLALLYPGYCIMTKRFNDFGKNGKVLAAIPYGISAVLSIWTAITTMGLLGGVAAGADPAALAAGGAAGLAGIGMLAMVGGLIGLAFLLWAGLSKGDPAPNAYGPVPTPNFGGSTPPAA